MLDRSAIRRPAFWNAQMGWVLGAGVAILLSLVASGLFGQEVFNAGGIPQFLQFFVAAAHPDLTGEFLWITWDATLVTLAYAVCGTVLSIALGLVGGVLASEVWWLSIFPRSQNSFIWLSIRSLLAVPRAIHELIWGLFFVNIFGLDPLVGILAIAIPYGAIVAKVFSELLDETPRQPLDALLNSGVAPLSGFLYSLLPQAFLDLLSYSFYRFECSIRAAAVLGIIGAGGLGYQIMLSLQSLRYEQLWTLFFALFALSGAVDLSSALLRRRLGSPSRLDLNLRKRTLTHTSVPSLLRGDRSNVRIHGSLSKDNYSIWQIWWQKLPLLTSAAVLVLIPFCFWYVQADFSKLWSSRTFILLAEVVRSTLPPAWTGKELFQLAILSLQTLAMSILAITLAGVGGVLLSFPAASNFFVSGGLLSAMGQSRGRRVWNWVGLLVTRSLLLLERAVPAPIWALVALFVLFPGILPGAIALGIHNMGILGRLMAEVNENLDQRPLLALKAQGTPASLVFLYGVLPLTLTRFLAYILYRWEVCMRETVIVGLVGAGGLGRLLTEQLSSFDYRHLVVTLGCFILLTFGVDWVSGGARRSLR